jgi:uncharacterized integral membrane protein
MALGGDSSDLQAGSTDTGPDRQRAMRMLVIGIVIVVAVIFMAQNNDRVELNFLFVSVDARLWVGLLLTLLLGAVLGQVAERLWERRKRRRGD